ncbi:hypothetical protein [Tessaracoccus coleopterorum]|uniref:hypothetical protein n=1 Tax=Tessaracoccus coleopterorum TaxID=2714950 RepID=UPI0018D44004|nr:hypothetical protein [Tessaracoccus coleopterorum]
MRLDRGELRRDDGTAFDEDVVAWVRDTSLPGIATAGRDWDEASGKLHQRIELRRMVSDVGQARLLDARALGVHRSSTIRRVQHLLDMSAAGHEGATH